MNHFLRALFFLIVVRPIMLVILGMNVRHAERLPRSGPAVIVANHNSHLDALALMTLYSTRELRHVQPVAAADYFFRNRWLKWFATQIIGIIPLQRQVKNARRDPLAPINEAIEKNQIVILFPEGTRGEPEQIETFKTGVAHIAKRHPDVDVVPIFMHGFGKALPRGEALLVPFFCDVFVGESFRWTGERGSFMDEMTGRIEALAGEMPAQTW